MTSTLLIFQIVLAVIIVLIVLLQKTSASGFDSYSGSNDSFFGARGPSGFLSKSTFVLGAIFVLNTLALGYLYNSSATKSVVDSVIQTQIPSAPISTQAPAAPNSNN